ncbi:rhomboid family intramembrane serine protease [Dehalogenimonas sp. 4OHTPN]|uniref:Rhomboid family intramembrane serine protease n=1 Tax=Dehalogenimonas sp. 4OHTPN TaxID=3166643 RepID=A0AAU8G8Y5_9CHLR
MYRRYQRPFYQDPLLVLIGLNVVFFLLTTGSDALLIRLAISPATFLSEPWTAITSMFVHAGLSHLLFNMLALYFFGSYLTQIVGERQMLAVYFIGGIVGSLFFWLLGPSNGLAVGASGAIFALGGALAVLRPMTKVIIFPIPIPLPLWVAVIGGGLLISLAANVAWESHLGGLITGIAAGLVNRGRLRL